jgi:hypothetical protein
MWLGETALKSLWCPEGVSREHRVRKEVWKGVGFYLLVTWPRAVLVPTELFAVLLAFSFQSSINSLFLRFGSPGSSLYLFLWD